MKTQKLKVKALKVKKTKTQLFVSPQPSSPHTALFIFQVMKCELGPFIISKELVTP